MADDIMRGPAATLVTLLSLLLTAVIRLGACDTLGVADKVRMTDQISAQLPNSGVTNPVTAVLLNFRAYDTLLELAVLLAAALGILAMGPARPPYRTAGPLLKGLIRWLVPLLILTAGYLLWAGAHAPGGAFQAGALLAAAAVMLRLGGHPGAGLPRSSMQRCRADSRHRCVPAGWHRHDRRWPGISAVPRWLVRGADFADRNGRYAGDRHHPGTGLYRRPSRWLGAW